MEVKGVLATDFKCDLAVLGSVLILLDHAQMPGSNALYSRRRHLCERRDLVLSTYSSCFMV